MALASPERPTRWMIGSWGPGGRVSERGQGAIAGIVIDDQDFERMIRPQVQQGFDHLADGTTFIECGQHDGQAAPLVAA